MLANVPPIRRKAVLKNETSWFQALTLFFLYNFNELYLLYACEIEILYAICWLLSYKIFFYVYEN